MLNNDNTDVIEISMLGGFSMRHHGRLLTDDNGRTRQVWNLLEYLICNRTNDITQDALSEVLWPGEETDDPTNALKNLVYRVRTMLKRNLSDAEYIVFGRNTYAFNPRLPVKIDYEILDALYRASQKESLTDDEKLKIYEEAIELYKGDFLPKSSDKEWVISRSIHCKHIYINCVSEAVKILQAKGNHYRIVEILNRALSFERYDENLHEQLIRAYLSVGDYSKALTHYEYVTNLFYRELGVRLSQNIRDLYREILKTTNDVEFDLSVICDDLQEAVGSEGAFFCEYEIFRNIYRLESRAIQRTGESLYLMLITVCGRDGMIPPQRLLVKAMDKLKKVLLNSLRKNDVVSMYSRSQFVVLLYSLTYENAEMIKNRLERNFYHTFTATGAGLKFSFQLLGEENEEVKK